MLKRIVFAPVCVVLYVVEVLLKWIENIYGFLSSCIFILMIIMSISAISRHLWNQLIITGLISLAAFIGSFIFAFLEIIVEDTRKALWGAEKELI